MQPTFQLTLPIPPHKLDLVRKAAALLLLLVFATTGTGALRYWHLMEHAGHHTKGPIFSRLLSLSVPDSDADDHDEATCGICSVLHMPVTASNIVVVLIFLGLFVAFLTLLDTPLIPRLVVARIDCRGPPVA